eukprot:scaffold50948_cov74-Phaeocystis_antarctica.AAC.2
MAARIAVYAPASIRGRVNSASSCPWPAVSAVMAKIARVCTEAARVRETQRTTTAAAPALNSWRLASTEWSSWCSKHRQSITTIAGRMTTSESLKRRRAVISPSTPPARTKSHIRATPESWATSDAFSMPSTMAYSRYDASWSDPACLSSATTSVSGLLISSSGASHSVYPVSPMYSRTTRSSSTGANMRWSLSSRIWYGANMPGGKLGCLARSAHAA